MAGRLRLVASFLILLAGIGLSPGASEPGLIVEPAEVRLRGSDSLAQLVVTVRQADGSTADLSGSARYSSSDSKFAVVDRDGLVRPRGEGATSVKVEAGGKSSVIKVIVSEFSDSRPVHFTSEIVPILSKYGCNAGGCHGKATGQNGFRLSLLGFDPKMDYEALVREGRGRRVVPTAPAESLLLKKTTAKVPHGGGRKFGEGTPEYNTIARWISQGSPYDAGKERALTGLSVEPAQRLVPRGGRQQVRVTAQFSDGTSADVTRLAQYQSNAADLATVDEKGVIQAGEGVGEAAIMARFGGLVAVARATVPHSRPDRDWQGPASSNIVDPHVFRKLKELGLRPSETCSDGEFIRRATLDLCGILPSPAEVAAFQADHAPDKRAKLVDKLIDRPEYADLFAMKWSTILKNKRTFGPQSQAGTFAFHAWIRQAMAENKPYDQFVKQIVTARGDAANNPPVVWYRQVNTIEERVDDTTQLFLGMRVQCARCHHHPFERWSQEDYYGFASLFTRIGNKPGMDQFTPRIYVMPVGLATNPMTMKEQAPKPLGGEALPNLKGHEDPREKLTDWMAKKDNPYFAKALVNRYWKHFFSRGLVEPEDDMRVSNPPANPELLDALADDFIAHGFDIKRLVRVLATSRAYDRSSLPNESNAIDRRNFARYYARRLPAEVMLDAVNSLAGTREAFAGLPAGFRATQLPDDGFDSAFLDIFGRPKRESVCECERSAEANLSQTLLLLNSAELQGKLTSASGRASKYAVDPRTNAEKVEELYRVAFARAPLSDESDACVELLERRNADKKLKQGYEDLIWALINTKEFLFNQ